MYRILVVVCIFSGISGASFPYRSPTPEEISNNTPIKVSNNPISDSDIAVEKRVLEFLVERKFFTQKKLNKWLRLAKLSELTQTEAIQMQRIKKAEHTAIKKFQKAANLPKTGIIDQPILQIVFGTICGTPDFNDMDEEKK